MSGLNHGGSKPPSAFEKTQHNANLDHFKKSLQRAVDDCMPTGVKPYKKVVVLMLHWANVDIGVEPLETELAEVFRKLGYTVQRELINTTSLTASTTATCTSFLSQHDEEGNLLIYVYSGHGKVDTSTTPSTYQM